MIGQTNAARIDERNAIVCELRPVAGAIAGKAFATARHRPIFQNDCEDLEQEAALALIEAVDSYSQLRGTNIGNHCVFLVKRRLINYLRKQSRICEGGRAGPTGKISGSWHRLGTDVLEAMPVDDREFAVVEARCTIRALAGAMTQTQRAVVTMLLRGMQQKKIAKARRVARPVISQIVSTAVKRMRKAAAV